MTLFPWIIAASVAIASSSHICRSTTQGPLENHCTPPVPSAAAACHRIYSQFKEFGCCDDCCEHVCGALRDDFEEEECCSSVT